MKLFRMGAAVLGTCMVLAGCGGGETAAPASAPAPMAPSAQAVRAQPALPGLESPITRAELLAWAEANVSGLFHGPATDGSYQVYDYRYYPQTGHYIGFDGDRVFVMGPATAFQIQYQGHLLDFACLARADLCDVARPRTQMQVVFDAIAQAPGGYSTFESTGPARSPTAWFYATRRMTAGPRATPAGYALDPVIGVKAPAGAPNPPYEFMACEPPYLRVVLDERGAPAHWCDSAPMRIQFVGDAIYATVLSHIGQPMARYEITTVTEAALQDVAISEHLRASVPVDHPLHFIQDSPNHFPASARGGYSLAKRLTPIVTILNPDGSMPASVPMMIPMDKAGSPGTPAATLEDVYGPQPVEGAVEFVNGRRARFANVDAPAKNNGAIELDGRVYRATLEFPDPTPRLFQAWLNQFARDAVLAWGLSWAAP